MSEVPAGNLARSWFGQVAGGGEHTLFALDTGDLYSCGAGSQGQLGNASNDEVKESSLTPGNEIVPRKILVVREAFVHVSAGHNHSAAISAGGTLYMWGDPRDGKLGHGIAKDSAASNDNDAVGINDDEFFTTLWPQPVLFFKSNERRIKFVSCGADHTLCLDDNGGIYSWGLGNYGNLGHGDTKNQIKPRLIESLKDSTIAFTAAGSKHSLGMSHSGIVYTWGHGDKGRLGNGDRRGSLIPEENAFFNSSAIRAVQGACGEAHTAVVGANGTLYTFGSGSYGRLGHGEELDVFVPKLVDTLQRENIAQVACGAFHTVILTSNGMIFSCGSGRYGQLGHDGFADGGMPNFLEPSLILEGGEVEYTLVACGTFHTIALTSDKKVRSWGFGGSGRLGHAPKSGSKSDSTLLDEYFKPTTILTLKNVDITGVLDLKEDQSNNADQEGNASTGGGKTPGGSSIAYSLSPKAVRMVDCGEQHTLMLTQSGHVWAWGNNSQGQLGIVIANSKRNFVSKPEQLTQSFSVHTMAFIAAGNKHSMAVTASGDVFTWGRGKEGQLGLGGSENKSEPQIVSSLQGRAVVFAAGGECMSAVIVEDGSLYTWGAGDLGKLGQGSISANQRLPRMVRGALLNEVVVQVSLGFEHSGCVTESGKLFTWGGGWFGRLGIGHTENQYTPVQVQSLQYKKCLRVSCGAYHTLAVTKQADLYSWGKASSGLGYSLPNGQESALLPQRVNHFKQIMESVCFAEAAYDHSIVITGKGHVHTFGKGKYGKLGSAFNLLDDEAEEDVMVPTVTRDLYGTHKEFQVGDVPWRDLSDEVRCVRAFTNHCVALTVKGDIYTWGNGGSGRLGHGTQKKEICPREVLHLPGVNDKKRKEGMEMYKTARKSAARLKKASPMNTSNLRNAARLARQQGRGGIVDGGSTGAAGGDAWGHGQAQGRDISGRSGQSNEGDPAKGIQGSGPGDGSGDGMGGKGRGGLDGATGLGQTEKRADGTTGDDSLGPMASNDMFNRGDKEALASQDVVTELAEGGSLSGDMQAGDGKGDLQTTLARAVAESQKDGASGDNDLAAQDGAVDIGGQSSVVEDFQILGQIPSAKYVQNKLELEKPEYSENNLTKLTNFSNRKRSIVCDHLVRCERLEDEISTTMYNIKWTVNAIVQTHDSGKDNRWATPRDVHARRLAIPVDIVPQKGNLERIFSLLRVQPNYLLGIYNYFIAANRDADTNVQHVKRFVDLVFAVFGDLSIPFNENRFLVLCNDILLIEMRRTAQLSNNDFSTFSVHFFKANSVFGRLMKIYMLSPHIVSRANGSVRNPITQLFKQKNTNFDYNPNRVYADLENTAVSRDMSLEKLKAVYGDQRVQTLVNKRIDDLSYLAREIFITISKSVEQLHRAVVWICCQIHSHLTATFSDSLHNQHENFNLLIGKFLIERLYGPMILNPAKYNVCQLPITPVLSKNLSLIEIALRHFAAHMPYKNSVPWLKSLSAEVDFNRRTAQLWSRNVLQGKSINMKTDLVIDMYREHLRPIENFTESIGLSNIKYVRYVLYKCVKVITSGRDDPMHKYVRGVNGLTYNLEDQKEAENFVRQCDYLDDSGIGLGLPEQYAVNITFHTRLMTTSGVEKLRAYEKSRSDEAQQDSRKFDSQGNKAEDSEFENIETIGDIIASPDDPTDDDENVARDQQNVVALFTDSRNGVPLPSYLATADATLLSHEKANGGMLLNKQQIAVREVIKQMEDLTESLADSAKLRRLLMKKIREQQVKDPESRNWDMQTNYRLAYDFLKSLPGSIDQLFGAFLLDIEERKNAGDMIVHEVRSLMEIENDIKTFYQYLLKRKNTCTNYLKQIYTGFEESQNEQVKRAIGSEKSNNAKMSKKKIGYQTKNELHDARILVQQLQYLSKPPSLEKLLLGRKNVFRGSFRCFSYMEMQQKDIVVMVDVTGLQDNHNEDKAEKNGEDIRKRVHYTFASKRPGVFLITTSYDKDFVLDVFSVETGQTVKLKNAMIRTWRPLGSQSTFIVSNLLELLQELTMKKLLLDFHPNKASK